MLQVRQRAVGQGVYMIASVLWQRHKQRGQRAATDKKGARENAGPSTTTKTRRLEHHKDARKNETRSSRSTRSTSLEHHKDARKNETDDTTSREREDPGGTHLASGIPLDRLQALAGTNTHDSCR